MRFAPLMWLVACGGPDLPEGWDDAILLELIAQRDLGTSPAEGGSEQLEWTIGPNNAILHYLNAPFRCLQDVEAWGLFVEAEALGVPDFEVLVQPVDMHPRTVVRSDCLYDIDVRLPLDAGAHKVRVNRRWDEYAGDTVPELVGDLEITVP